MRGARDIDARHTGPVSRNQFKAVWSALVVVGVCLIVSFIGLALAKSSYDRLDRQQHQIDQQNEQRQQGLCKLVHLLDPPAAPTPSPNSRAADTLNGVRAYERDECPSR